MNWIDPSEKDSYNPAPMNNFGSPTLSLVRFSHGISQEFVVNNGARMIKGRPEKIQAGQLQTTYMIGDGCG